MDEKVQELFKSFQEKVRLYPLEDVMYVVWGLTRNLQFDRPIPTDIQTRAEYDQSADIAQRRVWGINEWELEFILSEAIIGSPVHIHTVQSLRKIKNLGPIVNELRKLEDEISKLWLNKDTKTTFKEFFRTAHRQFPWQIRVTTQSTYRYYRIFSHDQLKKIVEEVIGLSPLEIYQIGMGLIGLFNSHFIATIPIKSFMKVIDDQKLGLFLYTFGLDISTLRNKLQNGRKIDETLVYSYNPMRLHPIIINDQKAYCPLPTLLLWQITSGIYYRIVNEKGFNEAFGTSFQDYVGFIIEQALTNAHEFKVYPEEKFGKPEKRTIDWVVEDKESFMMIECKGKRLVHSAKSELLDNTSIDSDLEKMSLFIVQGYKTIKDFKAGLYPHIEYKKERQIFLLILTLEEWFVNLNHEFLTDLRAKVQDKLGIDKALMDEIPYFIDSMESFERNLQLVNQIGIKTYFEKLGVNDILSEMEKYPSNDLLTKYFMKEIYNKTIGA